MRDGLHEGIHRANVVVAVTMPVFAVVAILLRGADEALLQVLGIVYLVFVFALFFALDERAERRRQSERRDQ